MNEVPESDAGFQTLLDEQLSEVMGGVSATPIYQTLEGLGVPLSRMPA